MKEMMIVCCMLFGTVTASAQFTVYQSAEAPHRSYTPSMGYGVPFTIYEPLEVLPSRGYSPQQKPAQPKMQEMTMKGYYKRAMGGILRLSGWALSVMKYGC